MITEQANNDLVTALQNTAGTVLHDMRRLRAHTFAASSISAQLVGGIRNDEPNKLNSQLANVDRVEC